MHETESQREQGKLPADYRPACRKEKFSGSNGKIAVILGNLLYNKKKVRPARGRSVLYR
ncbi:hypothetical protein HMPREF9413_5452 [Paenibacillus sp. HGF7]|nr:hypothetical protein HMPREF9413_5452 [Paenibacillus sp. HGF7]